MMISMIYSVYCSDIFYDVCDASPRRPPLELLFVELHEEAPVARSVSDLGATIRRKGSLLLILP